jgi:hypothetical protein
VQCTCPALRSRASQRGQGASVALVNAVRAWRFIERRRDDSLLPPKQPLSTSTIGTVCASSPQQQHTRTRTPFRRFVLPGSLYSHVPGPPQRMSTTHAIHPNMSTPRGGRGAERSRGARGGFTGNSNNNHTRGAGRGRGNGAPAQPAPERPTQAVYSRGGPRGGKPVGAARGSTASTTTRGSTRGRGHHAYVLPLPV